MRPLKELVFLAVIVYLLSCGYFESRCQEYYSHAVIRLSGVWCEQDVSETFPKYPRMRIAVMLTELDRTSEREKRVIDETGY